MPIQRTTMIEVNRSEMAQHFRAHFKMPAKAENNHRCTESKLKVKRITSLITNTTTAKSVTLKKVNFNLLLILPQHTHKAMLMLSKKK